jgi:hypothetical protein
LKLFDRRLGPPDRSEPAAAAPLAERSLFIMGAARTGTTVLQNALNDSRQVFLLGEPDIYDDQASGFRARYNAMHRSWGNQETKSTFLPDFAGGDGGWRGHLAAASRHHRWVGAKLVLNPVRAKDDLERRFDFHTREFFAARYIFTFRHPFAAAISTHGLQILTRGEADELRRILLNSVESIVLYIRCLRLFPHVRAVFHEGVDAAVFSELSAWLDVPLTGALAYYQPGRVRSYDPSSLDAIGPDILTAVAKLYEDLRAATAAGCHRLQLEQNDNHFDLEHYLPIGDIDRRARFICATLAD